MSNSKISALTSSTTPLAGTEVLPVVQSSTTKQVSVANLTVGRNVAMSGATVGTGGTTNFPTGIVLNGTSNSANGTYIQGQRNGSNAWIFGDTAASLGSGTGYLTYVYGANPFIVWTNNGEALNVTSTQDIKATLGNFVQGTAAKGINFTANTPAAGMTSQLLNWYEEGTWTPADNSGAGLSLTITYATYTRVGRQVTINAYLIYPSTSSAANAALTGLPFNCAANNYPPLTIDSNSGVALSSFVNAVSKNISIGIASNYATTVTNSSLSSKGIIISGTYFV